MSSPASPQVPAGEVRILDSDSVACDHKKQSVRHIGEVSRDEKRTSFGGWTGVVRALPGIASRDLDDIRSDLLGLLDTQIESMNWGQLGQVIALLKDLGGQPDVAKYQNRWIDCHPKVFSNEDIVEYVLPHVEDPVLKEKLEKEALSAWAGLDLVDCMKQVARVHSWGGDVETALMTATEEDFRKMLTTSTEPDLLGIVKGFLTLATSFGQKEQKWATCAVRVRSALSFVATTSTLNHFRVKRFFGSQVTICGE